jgi:hypothetical protein
MKWFLLLLVLAIAVGWYWMIATGTWPDRAIAMHMRKASVSATGEDMVSHLSDVRELVQRQEEWMHRLAIVARNPDARTVRQAAAVAQQLYDAAQRVEQGEGAEGTGSQAEALREAIRSHMSIPTGFLRPGQRTFWTVLFWISVAGAAITGLLSFVRSAADF